MFTHEEVCIQIETNDYRVALEQAQKRFQYSVIYPNHGRIKVLNRSYTQVADNLYEIMYYYVFV